MQRLWLDRTGASPEAADGSGGVSLPAIPPPLSYPAGRYDGLLFSARTAENPDLAEPVRP